MFLTRFVLVVGIVCSLSLLSPSRVIAADGKVTGSVQLDGKPVANGKITFHLKNGQFVGSKVSRGKYTVDRVPVGTCVVTIEGNGIPAKFAAPETSTLIAVIKEGDGNYDFQLKSK